MCRSRGWNANLEHKNSKYVVLTRVHYGMPFPKDLILNLRALMEESSQVPSPLTRTDAKTKVATCMFKT